MTEPQTEQRTEPQTEWADMLYNDEEVLDPIADGEDDLVKNRAKVGSARPSSLLYTYGPGAVMDLPNFSIMPAGLGDWEAIWKRREHVPTIVEPRLLEVVRLHLGPQVTELRPFPWQPRKSWNSRDGVDLGVPARVFPQWLRCTGCDFLGPLPRFEYTNTHPFRPDLAQFTHQGCAAKGNSGRKAPGKPAVPAQHLLTCANGHLDEFPYGLWVHRGKRCPKAPSPDLKMINTNVGSAMATITCTQCGATRGMAEAQGEVGRDKLPQTCRGRHPHLNAFDHACDAQPTLIMMGASNLWFPAIQSIIVMPRTNDDKRDLLADQLRAKLGAEKVVKYVGDLEALRDVADGKVDLTGASDDELAAAASAVLKPADSDETRHEKLTRWDPVDLLVPEWNFLQKPALFSKQEDRQGLRVSERQRDSKLPSQITRVVAVERMKKVNAVMGFTRLDELDRVGDVATRLVKLTRDNKPTWIPATEDRGEGVFLQLDLDRVQMWEDRIRDTPLWEVHRQSHQRNFRRRFSQTAADVDPDTRLPGPRYWLLHTFSHLLMREMAMSSGYGAASLTERIYGWPASEARGAAAGILICTTASDSDGTLGGLVELSEKARLAALIASALRNASRCSSDPICAMRKPSDPEDFLHGAACHACTFASETSCEKANRFLDRRFVLSLPSESDETVPGFFGTADDG